ncbi:MAG: DUF3298 domain-containing protein [Prevotella sp.]|nr:DUF3298 domain-containing protein [Prevotella sp.]
MTAVVLTGCNKKQTATAQAVATDTTTVAAPAVQTPTNELTTKKIAKSQKNQTGTYDLTIDFPVSGNATLVNAIREYISESLGSTYGGGEEDTKQGSYSGDLADGDKMADYYFDLKVKEFQAMYNEMKQDGMPEIPELASSTKITKDYETDRVVTYLFSSYENGGGAHGGAVGSGMTFRKSDGRRVDWDMFSSGKMQTVLRDGLKEYFEVKTDDELASNLTLTETYLLPMPVTPPIFGKDGIIVTYQQYEIAPYAAGMPSFVIPYNKAKAMMNNTGKQLIN